MPPRWLRRWFDAFRYLWASPATLVGVICALHAMASGARARLVGGVIEVTGGCCGRFVGALPRRCRFDAITFGHVVLCVDETTAASVRAHERVHVRQYERFGVLFFVLYAGSSLAQWLRGGRAYFDNRFEREARTLAGDQHC
jgi:hypothetical protein